MIRHLLLGRILRRELDLTIHPELVSRVRYNGRPVQGQILRAVQSFVMLYVGLFARGRRSCWSRTRPAWSSTCA